MGNTLLLLHAVVIVKVIVIGGDIAWTVQISLHIAKVAPVAAHR